MTRASRLALLVAVLVAVLLAAVAPAPAGAAEEPIRIGIHPAGERTGFIEVSLDPGTTATVSIDIVNAGGSVVVRTYAADAFTLVNGGFGARFEADPHTGPVAWLGYEAQSLELDTGAVVTRSATVSVPPGTPPGEYIAALVVQNEQPVPVASAGGLQQVVRSALAVVIDVPGPRLIALSVGDAEHVFAAGTSVIGFPAANEGNELVRPAAAFRLESSAGTPIASLDVTLDSFYGGLPARIEFPLDAALAPGRYCATLVLSNNGAPIANTGRDCFDVSAAPVDPSGLPSGAPIPGPSPGGLSDGGGWIPGLLVLLFLVLVISLWLLIVFKRRRRDRA
jgi:hypothetical protein